MDKMYRRVKELTWEKDKSQTNKSIFNKQGTLLNDPIAVKERWKEYIEELYYRAEKPDDIETESQNEVAGDQRGPEILDSELMQAIQDMESGKAEGEDGIPAEILKALDPETIKYLLHLCASIYTEGVWPQDFLVSIIVPLLKKPNAQRCEDHRTISLISHASKILLRVINNRLKTATETYIGRDQFGFRNGMGTREAIAVMRLLGERSMDHNLSLYACFVDYEKAF